MSRSYLVGTASLGSSSVGSVGVPSGSSGHPGLFWVTWQSTTITCTPDNPAWELVAGPDPIGTGQSTAVWRKTMDVSDSAVSFTLSGSVRAAAQLVVAVNGDLTQNDTVSSNTSSATSVTIPASNVATDASDVLVVAGTRFGVAASAGVTPPSGPPTWTEKADNNTTNTTGQKSGVWAAVRDTTVAAGAATTSATATLASTGWASIYTFLVKDAVVLSGAESAGWRFGRGMIGTLSTDDPPPPPPPPPSGVLAFGTTLFGQSFVRYKTPTISGSSARYAAVEADVSYSLGGSTRHGSAVVRVYGGNAPGTWSAAHPGFLRSDQPVIYSFKAGTEGQATFKANFRAFLTSKPTSSAFAWLTFWHEPDDEIFLDTKSFPGTTATDTAGKLKWWLDHNRWCREVLDEIAFAGRADVRFGPIYTGSPWEKGRALSDGRSWKSLYDAMVANRGGTDTWDYMGGDIYDAAWDGPSVLMPVANWILKPDQAFAATGLPFVIGEGGTPRPYSNYTTGYSKAQLETMRADWLTELFTTIRDRGYFDAFAWWREPALKGVSNAFSTIMATPTGYDAELAAAGITGPPNGFDSPKAVAVHSKFMVESIDAAQTNFAAGLAPHSISYA